MNEDEVERAAEEVLAAFEWKSLPVDPFQIAREEDILLIPGQYDGCFESRLEYQERPGGARFCLFYATESPDRNAGRIRFSIAHELGHYYLPKHRDYLLSSRIWHSSRIDFLQDPDTEREANFFAAALLMPRRLFRRKVEEQGGIRGIADLSLLAREHFKTSVRATVVRYVELDLEPCAVVISQSRYVQFCLCSPSMRKLGTGFFPIDTPIPSSSVTGQMLSALAGTKTDASGFVDSSVWFPGKPAMMLREQSRALGRTAQVLTLLTVARTAPP